MNRIIYIFTNNYNYNETTTYHLESSSSVYSTIAVYVGHGNYTTPDCPEAHWCDVYLVDGCGTTKIKFKQFWLDLVEQNQDKIDKKDYFKFDDTLYKKQLNKIINQEKIKEIKTYLLNVICLLIPVITLSCVFLLYFFELINPNMVFIISVFSVAFSYFMFCHSYERI